LSLLTICQDAADELGLDARPISIIGSQGVDELRLLRFANRVGRDLASRAPWQALRRERAFTTTATEVQAGAVPSDFLRFSVETLWNRTDGVFISGPIDPTEYQSRRSLALFYTSGTRWFTRRSNDLLLWPIPLAAQEFGFEYQSTSFCQSAGGVPQDRWLADSDTGRISEELITLGVIARFLLADGQPAQAAMADFERRLRVEIENDAPTAGVLVAGDLFRGVRHTTGEPGGLITDSEML